MAALTDALGDVGAAVVLGFPMTRHNNKHVVTLAERALRNHEVLEMKCWSSSDTRATSATQKNWNWLTDVVTHRVHNDHSAVTWYSDKMKRTMEIAEKLLHLGLKRSLVSSTLSGGGVSCPSNAAGAV